METAHKRLATDSEFRWLWHLMRGRHPQWIPSTHIERLTEKGLIEVAREGHLALTLLGAQAITERYPR
jgi:hypothetical protein